MKTIKAIELEDADFKDGHRTLEKWYDRLKPEAREAATTAEVVVYHGAMVKCRSGMSENQLRAAHTFS